MYYVGIRPIRLQEIVGALHPWLRSRICTIVIAPLARGGWAATLSYVAKTLPPPPDLQIDAAQATEPRDTHHALALPATGIQAALREQLRELAEVKEIGTLQVEQLPAGPPHAPAQGPLAWRITTHAGLMHQRRSWLTRIGRRDLH